MANPFDQFDAPAADSGNPFDQFDSPAQEKQKPSGLIRRAIGDTAVSALKGAIGLPESIVGLADMATGGYAGKLAEDVGFRPKEAKAALDDLYSPEQKEANQYVQDANGFVDTIKRGIQTPSVIGHSVIESLPQMLGGASVARGLVSAVPKLGAMAGGAIGEGIIGGGSAAEQLRQGSNDGLLNGQQLSGALASGAGTAAFGALGGKAAGSKIGQRLGLTDVDTAMAGGALNATNAGLAKRVAGGVISEGVLEEMPQSMWEQAAQNYATDKPLSEGVGQAAGIGLLTGGVMGGGFNAMPKPKLPDGGPLSRTVNAGIDTGATTLESAPLALGYQAGSPLVTFPDGTTMTRSEYEQRMATGEQQRLDGMEQDNPLVRMAERATERANETEADRELAGLVANEKADVDARRKSLSQIATDRQQKRAEKQAVRGQQGDGSFSGMNEFADLLNQEKQDVEGRRQGIANTQQLRNEFELQSADARVADQMARESEQRRRAVLESVLADPAVNNHAAKFSAELKRQGFRNTEPTESELNTVSRFNDVRNAEKAPNIEPSLPNEDQMGIKERKESSAPQGGQRDKISEVKQLVSDGWTISGRTLVSPTGKKRNLNFAEHYAARKVKQEMNGNSAKSSQMAETTQATNDAQAGAKSGAAQGSKGVASGVRRGVPISTLQQERQTVADSVQSLTNVDNGKQSAPDVIEVRDVYGRTHRVKQADIDGGADRIPTVRKNGDVVSGEEIPRSIIKSDAATESKQTKAAFVDQYSDENRKALYLDMKAKLMRGEITLQEGQREMSKFDEDAEAAKEGANSATAKAKKATPEDKGDVRYSKASLKSANVLGMADKDTVAGTQAPTSAGDANFGVDESTELPLNSDGTVTLYHHTSAEKAEQIQKTGKLKAAAEPDVYVTTRQETDTGYGDTAVPVRVNPELLSIDDEFPDGRKDFRLNVGKPGGSLNITIPNDIKSAGDGSTGSATIEVDGVLRSTLNSNGKPIHPTAEGIRNFWRWFAGSQIVDDKGRPIVFYHGTDVVFDKFSPDRKNRNVRKGSSEPFARKAFWLTDNEFVAQKYARYANAESRLGEVVQSMYVRSIDPRTVDMNSVSPMPGEHNSRIKTGRKPFDKDAFSVREIGFRKEREVKDAVKNNNDSVLFLNGYDGEPYSGRIIAVFDGENVMNEPSASAGSGADIRRSESSDSSAGIPISRNNAEKRIKALLGDKAGKALIESGIISITNKGSEYKGATYGNGNVVLNLGALTYDNFDGVLAHEGLHSTLRELVGDQTYSKLLNQLDAMVKLGKGSQWVQDAKAAIPEGTNAAHINEEIAAYAVEAHVNGQKLPSTLQRWVNSFLSAIRSAIIQRMQDGKLKMWAIKNLQAEDLARLAIAGLKAKAAGQLQGQGRLAESVMFSLKRAFSGKHEEKQFIVPETGAYLKDQSLIDLAYLDGKPIRLQVGSHSKKFGIMHLLGNAADDSRRGYESVTDDDAENAVRGLIDLLRRKDLQLHGDTDPILRSAFSKRSIVLNDVGPFYTVTTVRPSEANKWGDGNRIAAGRLTFPVDAELGTATSEMGRTGDKGQAPAPSGREVISTKFNPNEIGKERQVKVTVKKARVLVREDAGSAVQSTTSASEGVVNTSETSGGQSVTNVSDNDGERKYSKINQTATDAFKKWFGDSKVVDAERKPLVVYHGTGSDFESFDRATVGAAIDSGKLGEGFYFSQSHKWAGAYADNAARRNGGSASVMPVYLSIKNPVILDGPGNVWGKLERVSNDWGIESRPVIDDLNTPNPEWSKAFTAEAERRGFDGVILPLKFGESEFVAFRPDQIKSATGNNGDFAENNPDIRYSKSKIIGDSGRSYDQSERDFFKNVGREINPETRVEKTLGYLKNDFWKKMAVGIVDQFRGLRDLNDSGQSYMLARLSKGTAGAFDALLHHGKLSIKDGVYDADTSGGFIEKLGSPLNGELDDVLWWIAANRAEKLTAEGKENLFSAQDIAAGKGLSKGNTNFDYTIQTGPGKGKVTRNRAMIYADANRIFNDFQKNTLDIAEQSGLIDGSVRKFWESEFYVPFYRVSEEDGEFIGSKMGNALVRQQAFKKLKGGTDKLNSDLLSNTLMNWSHLIEASAKNRAAKAALTASEKVGAAQPVAANMGEYSAANGKMLPPGTKKTVWFMDGGQKKEYLVTDPFVMTAITSLEYAGMRNGVMDVLTKFKHYLTVGVTASPAFKVRNLIRDSIQAIGTSDLGYNPIKNVVEGFKQTKRDSQEYVSALASGGLIRFGTMLEGSESARTRQLIRNGVKDSTILNSEGKWKDFFNQYIEPGIEAYNEIGNRSEEINRAALYNQLIKQGKSHAEAALMARDLMDFSMQGSFNTIRFLSQVTPFFNARLQGMYKLGRAAKEDPAKMAIVTGAVALAGMSLMLAYGDDEDWKKREDWDLNQYFWFKIGDTAFRIPRPFEIGAVASLAERGLQYMIDDEMTGERFRKVVGHLLMDNLSMNPTPQAIKPIVDLYANRDSFTGRPIETMAMEKVDPTERYTSNTSMVARGASKALAGAASPVQIDHLARSYFGWLGAFVVGGADMAARAMSDEPTKPTLDYFKFATQGIVSESNSPSSRYVTNIYDQAKELEQAYGTWRRMLKEGKIEDAKQYAEDNRDKLSRYKSVESVKKVEAKFSERIRQIERSSLDPDEKKAQIANVNRMKDFAARRLTPGYSAQ